MSYKILLFCIVTIKTFSAKDLEHLFDQLDVSSKQDILGFIPDEILPVVEFDALNEAVSYLTLLYNFINDAPVS